MIEQELKFGSSRAGALYNWQNRAAEQGTRQRTTQKCQVHTDLQGKKTNHQKYTMAQWRGFVELVRALKAFRGEGDVHSNPATIAAVLQWETLADTHRDRWHKYQTA